MSERKLHDALGRWRTANGRADKARLALRSAISEAVDGGMSQSDVARVLGWPRQRVSKLISER